MSAPNQNSQNTPANIGKRTVPTGHTRTPAGEAASRGMQNARARRRRETPSNFPAANDNVPPILPASLPSAMNAALDGQKARGRKKPVAADNEVIDLISDDEAPSRSAPVSAVVAASAGPSAQPPLRYAPAPVSVAPTARPLRQVHYMAVPVGFALGPLFPAPGLAAPYTLQQPAAPAPVLPRQTPRAVREFITHPARWRLDQRGRRVPHPVGLVARFLPTQDVLRLRQVVQPYTSRAIDNDPVCRRRLFLDDGPRPRPAASAAHGTTIRFVGMQPTQLNPLLFSGRANHVLQHVKFYWNPAVNCAEITWTTSRDLQVLYEESAFLRQMFVSRPAPTRLSISVRNARVFRDGLIENAGGIRFGQVLEFGLGGLLSGAENRVVWRDVVWEMRFPAGQRVQMGSEEA